jgi:hypothetical protein
MATEILTEDRRVYYRFENIDAEADLSTVEVLESTLDPEEQEVRPPNLLPRRYGFFRRLSETDEDRTPERFDWLMGVILPLVCVAFDPGIFRSVFYSGSGVLGDYQIFAYVLGAVSIMTIIAWFLWDKRIGWLAPCMAGTLFSASLVSLVIGILLFPFSILGMILIIGFLGFTPLFFSFVCFRTGMQALRTSLSLYEKRTAIHIVVLSALLSLAIPSIAQQQMGTSLNWFRNPSQTVFADNSDGPVDD